MSIFGIAKRGFGMLKKSKKGIDPKKRLETFKKASNKISAKNSLKKIDKDFKKASERALKFSKKLEK